MAMAKITIEFSDGSGFVFEDIDDMSDSFNTVTLRKASKTTYVIRLNGEKVKVNG